MTNFMKFATNNNISINFNISYDNKTTEKVLTTKFLGLQLDNNLNWKKHTEYIYPKLSSGCFAIRAVIPLLKVDTVKLVYFAYFHSIMSYGVLGKFNRQQKRNYHPKENH
jgi:hypothetical protein